MEDMRGIEGLFEKLEKEAEEAAVRHEKYKELGQNVNKQLTPDYNNDGTKYSEKNGENGENVTA